MESIHLSGKVLNESSLSILVKKVWLILKCLLEYHAMLSGTDCCYPVLFSGLQSLQPCASAGFGRMCLAFFLKWPMAFIDDPFLLIFQHWYIGSKPVFTWLKWKWHCSGEYLFNWNRDLITMGAKGMQWRTSFCIIQWNGTWPLPDATVNFATIYTHSREKSGQRATLLCWELHHFTAALQLHCLPEAAAGWTDTLVSTPTKHWWFS